MPDDIAGEVAIVTGASRGPGLETARELASRQARVVICARDERELSGAAEDLRVCPGLTVRLAHAFAASLPAPAAPGRYAAGADLRPALPNRTFRLVTTLARAATRRLHEYPARAARPRDGAPRGKRA